jgi:adenylate kinase
MGPPGSGKGTLASVCTKRFGWKQISTGNLCRKHIAEQTEIGKEIDLIIKSGKLISDTLITYMVSQWLSENATKTSAIILDGYPRTVRQAQLFNKIIAEALPLARICILVLSVSDATVINRLCRRFVCQNKECQAVYASANGEEAMPFARCKECGDSIGRRADDEESVIKNRLTDYYAHEKELLNFYRNSEADIIELEISADQSISQVFERFVSSINEK